MTLWRGREKAKAHLQDIHWNTRMDEYDSKRVHSVYTELYGEERANSIVSKMARSKKEAEATERLNSE